MKHSATLVCVLLAAGVPLGCRSGTARGPRVEAPVPATPGPDPGPVRKVDVEIVVAAWAEPSRLGYGGGDAQILVRVQRRGGAPMPGVEVRLSTSDGRLFSAGRVLTTDARGMTRDRLSARRTAIITLNAGGTRYRFRVPVALEPD